MDQLDKLYEVCFLSTVRTRNCSARRPFPPICRTTCDVSETSLHIELRWGLHVTYGGVVGRLHAIVLCQNPPLLVSSLLVYFANQYELQGHAMREPTNKAMHPISVAMIPWQQSRPYM